MIRPDRFRDLPGQFAGRRQDQTARGLGVRLAASRSHQMYHRQAERGRLAGAGLGQTHHVAPLKDQRDRLFLNRRWLGHALFGQSFDKSVRKTKFFKSQQILPSLRPLARTASY